MLVGAIVVAVALLTAPVAGAVLVPGGTTAVLHGPEGSTTVDLAVPGRYVVAGSHGSVVFEVVEGSIRVVHADCPDGVCMRMGPAAPGRPVVCAPNGVSACIVGGAQGGLDAVSR